MGTNNGTYLFVISFDLSWYRKFNRCFKLFSDKVNRIRMSGIAPENKTGNELSPRSCDTWFQAAIFRLQLADCCTALLWSRLEFGQIQKKILKIINE